MADLVSNKFRVMGTINNNDGTEHDYAIDGEHGVGGVAARMIELLSINPQATSWVVTIVRVWDKSEGL